MLNSLRNFTKSFWAKILLVIVIIPFVFWGMGSVFSGGGTNTLAKINEHNISTKEFMDHLNELNMNQDVIKENIDNSIIEQLLRGLVNRKILNLESEKLNIILSDNVLYEIIKNDEKFFDKNKKFSRVKYEKFLLSNNVSAIQYENNLKKEQINKLLFNYISGGTFPPNFAIKNIYNMQNKKIIVEAINIVPLYKKEEDFTDSNIKEYIETNKDKLKEDFISFKFASINPLLLVESEEYNELFFQKIDEIEELIINGADYQEIIIKYNLTTKAIEPVNKTGGNEEGLLQKDISQNLINKVFEIKSMIANEIHLLELKNEYILIKIDKIENKLPNLTSKPFKNKIVNGLIRRHIFEHNNRLIAKIKTNSFKVADFNELSKKNKIKKENIEVNGIRDNNFFSPDTNNQLFQLKENSFTIVDEINKNKTFLVWVKDIEKPSFSKSSNEYDKFFNETIINLKNNIYSSYDNYINQKYKVEINYKTLDRVKNYFR